MMIYKKIDVLEAGKTSDLFEDFLKEQGNFEESTEQAVKRVIAFQLAAAMKEQHISNFSKENI